MRTVEKMRPTGASLLSGMQDEPVFARGMSLGGGDYINFVNDGKMPMSLAAYLTDQLDEA